MTTLKSILIIGAGVACGELIMIPLLRVLIDFLRGLLNG